MLVYGLSGQQGTSCCSLPLGIGQNGKTRGSTPTWDTSEMWKEEDEWNDTK
jgi:hypothetical protein